MYINKGTDLQVNICETSTESLGTDLTIGKYSTQYQY